MGDRKSSRHQRGGQRGKAFHDEGGVGFSCRGKVLFDPEVNLHFTILEPAAAARGETGRFFGLRDSEDSLIEFSGIALSARGHCEQDMIQPADAHRFTFLGPIETQGVLPRKKYPQSVRCGIESRRTGGATERRGWKIPLKWNAARNLGARQPNSGSLDCGVC
jgi:hypothetical protein